MKGIDLTNQRFGKLLVLRLAPPEKQQNKNKKRIWECQCDCGNICYKTADSLKAPIKTEGIEKACSKRCGAAIEIGTRFGKLVVLENIWEDGKNSKCLCQCDCGNTIITPSARLKKGGIKSCGCYRIERMSKVGQDNSQKTDLTNQRFGKLIALFPTKFRQGRSVIWECQCDCGNRHLASVSNLKSGSVSRCESCKIKSKGEEKISQILLQHNISFTREQTFATCINLKTGKKLRFDFYVNNQYLIEFDGRQHFYPNNGGDWGDENTFKELKQRDEIKNNWAFSNNIPIIRIPYTILEFLTIEDLKLETTEFLLERKV